MTNIAGLIVIATGNYDCFIEPLLKSVDRHFFKDKEVDVYLFDDKDYSGQRFDRLRLVETKIPHLSWPYPTLYRYKWISQNYKMFASDFLYYCDVDMRFVGDVAYEILPEGSGLVATRHPGYYKGGWGDNGTKIQSSAFVAPSQRGHYYAGGFQGGERLHYLAGCIVMAENITKDEAKGVIAHWHDESSWNKYLIGKQFKELSPAYCMVEQTDLRIKWGIDKITPKILALSKDHNKLRT